MTVTQQQNVTGMIHSQAIGAVGSYLEEGLFDQVTAVLSKCLPRRHDRFVRLMVQLKQDRGAFFVLDDRHQCRHATRRSQNMDDCSSPPVVGLKLHLRYGDRAEVVGGEDTGWVRMGHLRWRDGEAAPVVKDTTLARHVSLHQ